MTIIIPLLAHPPIRLPLLHLDSLRQLLPKPLRNHILIRLKLALDPLQLLHQLLEFLLGCLLLPILSNILTRSSLLRLLPLIQPQNQWIPLHNRLQQRLILQGFPLDLPLLPHLLPPQIIHQLDSSIKIQSQPPLLREKVEVVRGLEVGEDGGGRWEGFGTERAEGGLRVDDVGFGDVAV